MTDSKCNECRRLDDLSLDGQRVAGEPTRWWHCDRCNAHLDRYRGDGDQTCICGASYNAFGQRLCDDWRNNRAWTDEDVDDLEGYERACLRAEI